MINHIHFIQPLRPLNTCAQSSYSHLACRACGRRCERRRWKIRVRWWRIWRWRTAREDRFEVEVPSPWGWTWARLEGLHVTNERTVIIQACRRSDCTTSSCVFSVASAAYTRIIVTMVTALAGYPPLAHAQMILIAIKSLSLSTRCAPPISTLRVYTGSLTEMSWQPDDYTRVQLPIKTFVSQPLFNSCFICRLPFAGDNLWRYEIFSL